jgi:hypothetical protein
VRAIAQRPASVGRRLAADPWPLITALVVLAAGVALRWWILGTELGTPDLDEATVGLQARRFLDGDLEAFFPNQAYGGTLETLLIAAVFAVAGSSALALKVVPMALALAAAGITRQLAAELGLNRTARWVAPALVWCGPAFAVHFSTKARGFYGVALVLAAAIPWLVLRIARRAATDRHQHVDVRREAIALGACLGLGWWQTPLTFAIALPALCWLVLVRPTVVTRAGWAAGAALVGAAPALWWNATNGWSSVRWAGAYGASWWDRFFAWLEMLGIAGGTATPFDAPRVLLGATWVGVVAVLGVLVAASIRTHWEAPWFLPTLVGGYGLLYAVNGRASLVGDDPRYLYLLVPVLAVAVAALVPDARDGWRRAGATLAVTAASVAVAAWGIAGLQSAAQRPSASPFLSSAGIDEVVDLLERRADAGAPDAAVTDIAGAQIAFLSDEQVVGASFSTPRFADHELRGRLADPSTYVLDRRTPRNLVLLREWLAEREIGFEERQVGTWQVFLLDERVAPGDVGLYVYGGRLRPAGR